MESKAYDDDENTDGTKEESTENMPENVGVLYKRLISNLKSEKKFKKQFLAKEKSAIQSDSKKKNKEISNTETNDNSQANNNVARQRTETEKTRESGSRVIQTRYNRKSDQNKILKKLHNANVYVRRFLEAKVCYMKD